MIDYQRLYHTGVRVPDLDSAMAEMGETLGLTWATPVESSEQQVWTPEHGSRGVGLRFSYSCEGPQHIELLEGEEDSIWHAGDEPGVHHVGLWVDDVRAETDRCLEAGWTVAGAQRAPADGYGSFAYVQPLSGTIVELVDSRLQPLFENWWAGGSLR